MNIELKYTLNGASATGSAPHAPKGYRFSHFETELNNAINLKSRIKYQDYYIEGSFLVIILKTKTPLNNEEQLILKIKYPNIEFMV